MSGLHHETVAEVTAPWDPNFHFTEFNNSIFVQKRTSMKLLGQMHDHTYTSSWNDKKPNHFNFFHVGECGDPSDQRTVTTCSILQSILQA